MNTSTLTSALEIESIDSVKFVPLPEWAGFFLDLGVQLGEMSVPLHRFVRIVIIPVTGNYVANFISLGNMLAKVQKPFLRSSHVESLQAVTEGSHLVRIQKRADGWKKQRVVKFLSKNPETFMFEYSQSGHQQRSIVELNNPIIESIHPVYVQDDAQTNRLTPLNLRMELLSNARIASHYSLLLNPPTPYCSIIGSPKQLNDELAGLRCRFEGIEFRLNDLVITESATLFQANTMLYSGQQRTSVEEISSDLVIFDGSSSVLNHANNFPDKHHVYVLDYRDTFLDIVVNQIKQQLYDREDVDIKFTNRSGFSAGEISAFFVRS